MIMADSDYGELRPTTADAGAKKPVLRERFRAELQEYMILESATGLASKHPLILSTLFRSVGFLIVLGLLTVVEEIIMGYLRRESVAHSLGRHRRRYTLAIRRHERHSPPPSPLVCLPCTR
jgi:hypothetical protein